MLSSLYQFIYLSYMNSSHFSDTGFQELTQDDHRILETTFPNEFKMTIDFQFSRETLTWLSSLR